MGCFMTKLLLGVELPGVARGCLELPGHLEIAAWTPPGDAWSRDMVCGMDMVCIWYGYDLDMVCIWYVYGMYMVCVWYVCGMYMVYIYIYCVLYSMYMVCIMVYIYIYI